jgi:tyrosinase
LNPANRTNAIYGTVALGDPTAPATKLSDTMTLGHAYPGSITVGDAMRYVWHDMLDSHITDQD